MRVVRNHPLDGWRASAPRLASVWEGLLWVASARPDWEGETGQGGWGTHVRRLSFQPSFQDLSCLVMKHMKGRYSLSGVANALMPQRDWLNEVCQCRNVPRDDPSRAAHERDKRPFHSVSHSRVTYTRGPAWDWSLSPQSACNRLNQVKCT